MSTVGADKVLLISTFLQKNSSKLKIATKCRDIEINQYFLSHSIEQTKIYNVVKLFLHANLKFDRG